MKVKPVNIRNNNLRKMPIQYSLQNVLRRTRAPKWLQLFLAEMMGTFILMVFGIGSIAQAVLSSGSRGTFLSINMGWGFGVTFGVYWCAHVSGGHINPAVTLAMAVFGRLQWKRVPLYWAAQSLGSFLASAICYGIYRDALVAFEGHVRSIATAGIWSTYPPEAVSNTTGFFDQLFGTALLVGTIFALTDKNNKTPKPHILPVVIGFVVWAIGMTFGMNAGYGINPARDLIPRIFTAIAGWGTEPFTTHSYWFWCPILGQLLGGVLGALVYILTIGWHLEAVHEENRAVAEASFAKPASINDSEESKA